MKFLPCRECRNRCQNCSAVHARSRAGEPLRSGRYAPRYVCHGCGRIQNLSAADWARIPTPTLEQYQDHGLGDLVVRDLVGAGLKQGEAEDVFRVGIRTSHDVAAESRPKVDLTRRRQPRDRIGRYMGFPGSGK